GGPSFACSSSSCCSVALITPHTRLLVVNPAAVTPYCTYNQKVNGSIKDGDLGAIRGSMRNALNRIAPQYHAMDAGRLEQQVASVERGIAFLKQEHLAMLTGLQLEITHLKRRCQELSCELDSKFPDRNTSEEEEELAARCEAAERLLEDQQCMMVAVRGELRAGRARTSALGRSLREEERRFLDELKRRSHKITLLSRELQRQNVTTTTLCHELHTARLKLFQQRQSASSAAEGEEEPRGKDEEEEEEEDEDEEDEDDEGGAQTGYCLHLLRPLPANQRRDTGG
ncbi:hypothetical protein INR49_011377, partial [Caranx melampygus]